MKYIRLIPCFLLSFMLQGECFQPMNGMNLWRMTEQVGSCLDIYGESIIEELDLILCSVGNVIPLTQADFTSFVTINAPGYYKLCENITTTTNQIFIRSSDVILDLGDYFLEGVFIIIENNIKNISIKNGLMRNNSKFIDIGSSTQNILIQNMVFDTNTVSPSKFCINAEKGPITGLTIRDVTFYNAAPEHIMLNRSASDIVSHVILENINCVSTNQALTAIPGSDATIYLIASEYVHIKNLMVVNPKQGIDCILLDTCNGVDLEAVSITSDFPSSGNAVGIKLIDCNNVNHANVAVFGSGFKNGFQVSTQPAVSSVNIFYNACSATEIEETGFELSTCLDTSWVDCKAISCGLHGIRATNSSRITCTNCNADNNGGSGIFITLTDNLVIKDSICIGNGGDGISCVTVDNVVISGCNAQDSTGGGFFIQGVNNGSMPGNPEGITGRSPVFIDGCSALQNGANGFYTTNVGGVLVTACFASYNGVNGFHFDTGSWNVIVENCNALSNGVTGFLTWDTTVVAASLYNNRFRDCYAAHNGTNFLFNPAGGSDFAQSNTPGFQSTLPIASLYPSSILGLPEAALFGTVSPVFCAYI